MGGPEVGRFVEMVCTNMRSTRKPGKGRYGLRCNENGVLIDDGVVARRDEETFLCHTTTGGAESIHGHMEEWLQTEWWDWKVYVANVTEQYAQIGIAGPTSRKVLEKLTDDDVSAEALTFMGWKDITRPLYTSDAADARSRVALGGCQNTVTQDTQR